MKQARPGEQEIEPESDWHGILDRAERRRRQNRINQRTYRRRRRCEAHHDGVSLVERPPEKEISDAAKQHILHLLTLNAYRSYILGDPSRDHMLSLTRANVYRAFIANIALLGLKADGLCETNVLSPFNLAGPAPPILKSLPRSLSPTPIQRSSHHHPWVDFFPYPQIRDNLIQAQGRYDKSQFCLDILGFWDPGSPENMMLVWGEPFDPASWEVTESFVKKWGWVIRGCPEILYSTNQWRARRGDTMIFRYL
ncbi:hypothetical protein BDV24DRAFT_154665 [Aspergillus arachidicola]|uniref:BZIP domain-containing protein n=1 Tax=Aspergillus arachidicola TaxID=656916 RepID=A0A5N6XVD7_9EURO|nr:hypothetical protein BDV24DRAFT_154665 [Aspergillus arachidicola]